MRRQHNIPTFTSIIANRHSAAVWARIARTTPATAPRAILVTTEVANNGIRKAGAQEIMSPMGRPFNPRSTSAKSTRATVATPWVAAGRHIVLRRHNVLCRAGTKGIAGTRARRQGGVAPGPRFYRTQGAGQKTTRRLRTTVPVMSPFGTSRGVRVWHWHPGVTSVVLIHFHVLIVS